MAGAGPAIVDRDEILGDVRLCFGCYEWWPNDEDFWRPERWSRRALCRACAIEGRRRSMREATRRYRARRSETGDASRL